MTTTVVVTCAMSDRHAGSDWFSLIASLKLMPGVSVADYSGTSSTLFWARLWHRAPLPSCKLAARRWSSASSLRWTGHLKVRSRCQGMRAQYPVSGYLWMRHVCHSHLAIHSIDCQIALNSVKIDLDLTCGQGNFNYAFLSSHFVFWLYQHPNLAESAPRRGARGALSPWCILGQSTWQTGG